MKQLLLATTNPGKLAELKKGLRPLMKAGFELVTLADYGISEDVEETGKTFSENSRLKAGYYGRLSGLPTVADDGGFVIEALNGEPGVKSKRWLGREATDDELIDYTLQRVRSLPKAERRAYLETHISFYDPRSDRYMSESASISGHIADKPTTKRIKGFPYRALLVVDKFGKYYDELTEAEHEIINHRLKALKRLVGKIKEHYAKRS